ncbi:hypothetical protein F2P56_035459 [Juglans regia]|uniref:Reverse transcriptase zinc-binding domain-containing protein n=1 Tax=Juglans regia TaxID=51240 RepID=A0A833WTJ1_JUGRE|nr:hypothetical protein F2P56_035459 [Juglans regia]
MLPPAAANEVLKLIITSSCHQDKTIWEREKNGCFTVRSAYKMFKCMENNDSHGETSHANRKQQFWKSLWKLKVPNKVKIFVWKACRDGFPTRLNLRKKQVVVDDICQLCSKSVEDTTHALYQCPHLLAGWKNLFPELHLNATNTTFEEVAIHVQESKKTKALEMLFLLAWGSWYRRNQWLFEDKQLQTATNRGCFQSSFEMCWDWCSTQGLFRRGHYGSNKKGGSNPRLF